MYLPFKAQALGWPMSDIFCLFFLMEVPKYFDAPPPFKKVSKYPDHFSHAKDLTLLFSAANFVRINLWPPQF